MIHLVHFNIFYEFGSIEPNPKKHQKNAKISETWNDFCVAFLKLETSWKKLLFYSNNDKKAQKSAILS